MLPPKYTIHELPSTNKAFVVRMEPKDLNDSIAQAKLSEQVNKAYPYEQLK